MTNFYDSTRPGLIPGGSHVVLYYDGDYAATPQQAKRFAAVRWNTVFGTAAAAAHAGSADYEPGNPVFGVTGALREWALARQAMGCRARVYCDRDNLKAAVKEVGDLANVVFWVATLDGREWTAGELIADLAAIDLALTEDKLWGVQFAGGEEADWDESILFLDW